MAEAGTAEPRDAPSTAGGMLRALRESARVELATMAGVLKISPEKLRALEEDRYEALPDLSFARGMAALICRDFGVDPAPVLALMPKTVPELETPERRLNQPFRQASDLPAPLLPSSISRPLFVIGALLLVGALLIWLWPTLQTWLGKASTDAAQVEQPTAAPVLAELETAKVDAPAAVARVDAEPSGAAAAVAPQPASGDVQTAPDGESGTAGRGAAESGSTAAVAAAAQTPAPALTVTAKGDSWVSVLDGGETPLVNRLLKEGEVVSVNGRLPLFVTIGDKDAVVVQVHGAAFDHRALGKASVVRFKVE